MFDKNFGGGGAEPLRAGGSGNFKPPPPLPNSGYGYAEVCSLEYRGMPMEYSEWVKTLQEPAAEWMFVRNLVAVFVYDLIFFKHSSNIISTVIYLIA